MLFDQAAGFVLTQRHNFRMSKVIAFDPRQEFDLSYNFWVGPRRISSCLQRLILHPSGNDESLGDSRTGISHCHDDSGIVSVWVDDLPGIRLTN
jgi:hypothetical protein